ncbi:MAG: amino acid ABC transporter permease [Alphaproteobacteria bacterium]
MSLAEAHVGSGFTISRLWTEKRYRSVLFQLIALILLVALIFFIANNTIANLQALGVSYGFEFLSQPSNYDINQRLIDYDSTSTHGRAAIVGLLNTLLVAICGIVLATLLGFTFGVLRLSNNWVVSRLVYVYIESVRNVPVLLQILLWHASILNLPTVKNAFSFFSDTFILSNRGLTVPGPQPEPGFQIIPIVFLIAVVGAIIFGRWAKRVQDESGKIYPVFWINTVGIVGLTLLAFVVTGTPLSWEMAEMGRFNLKGGVTLRPEFIALWLALSFYTAAFIAEVVRAGIQSVSRGQTEAAYSLGLGPGRTTRMVIIPQAMRVIVPPLTSQYLNLTKNSSLAIAIGYMDITATLGGITLNQTGQAMEAVMLLMAVYLSFSLFTSLFMNWYNHRTKLVER